MHSKHIAAVLCAAGCVFGALADEQKPAATEQDKEVAEASAQEDSFPVSAEFGIAYDSKFVSYGLIDGKNPVVTPSGALTLFDLLTFDASFVMDTTHYSRKLGIGDRRWQYWELDTGATLSYSFSPDDFSFLPTTVEASLGYAYEYHPRRAKCKSNDVNGNPDTQFITAEIGLPDLWFEPVFSYERDIDRDNGTYLNLEIGHEFDLIEARGEDEDALLSLDIRFAQGFGNAKRVAGYITKHEDEEPLDHAGLMDTQATLTLNYRPTSWLTISPYVAYVDFLFDRQIRDESRYYNPQSDGSMQKDTSWHFLWGIAATATF